MKDNIVKYLIGASFVILLTSVFCDFILTEEINSIRQDIVEIKKDYSYDPRDAK
jgi:hypothetical protein